MRFNSLLHLVAFAGKAYGRPPASGFVIATKMPDSRALSKFSNYFKTLHTPVSPGRGGKPVPNPTDRGKTGVKRSLLTEAQGIPLGVAVDGANRHDMKLVRATVDSLPVHRPAPTPERSQGLCLDKGYDFDEVRQTLQEFGFTAHIRSRGEEAQAIKKEAGFKARRWVVERTHSWMNRFRRILVRWEKSPENYVAFLHFACALITLRAAGLVGHLLAGLCTFRRRRPASR